MTAPSRGSSTFETATKRRWRTPMALFRTLHAEFNFDLDATAEDDRLLPTFIAPREDALVVDWSLRGRRAWCNPPWGSPRVKCEPGCRKDHVRHFREDFGGTGAFVDRAIQMAPKLSVVVLLLPTAPDTAWWRAAAMASAEVRLLPRVSFIDADTLDEMTSPPGAGCTLFVLRPTLPDRCPVDLYSVDGLPINPPHR